MKGRLEPIANSLGLNVFVDYAHTHNALENVLRFLSDIKDRKIITVFGCGGDRDRDKRPAMGEAAERYSDYIILTNDNPRTENPDDIISDIKNGIKNKEFIVETDRKKAIKHGYDLAGEDDILVIAGKGHETYQDIGGNKLIFSDSNQVRLALQKRSEKK